MGQQQQHALKRLAIVLTTLTIWADQFGLLFIVFFEFSG
jgi:hypothetical protein